MHGRKVDTLDKAGLSTRLHEFEQQFGMSSQEFLDRYCRGDRALDEHQFVAWAALCDVAVRAKLLTLPAHDQQRKAVPA